MPGIRVKILLNQKKFCPLSPVAKRLLDSKSNGLFIVIQIFLTLSKPLSEMILREKKDRKEVTLVTTLSDCLSPLCRGVLLNHAMITTTKSLFKKPPTF